MSAFSPLTRAVPYPLRSYVKGFWLQSFRWCPPRALGGLEVCVSSGGGVGTTFLIAHLASYVRCNDRDDKDRLKHMPALPSRGYGQARFVYVCGDPVEATLSLIRRSFAVHQARKNGVLRPRLNVADLDGVLRSGSDPLGLTRNLLSWTDAGATGPAVMVVRYEKLWDVVPAMAEALGLPEAFVATFPERRERQTRFDEVPDQQMQRLREMYAPAYERLEALGDFKTLRWEAAPKDSNGAVAS
ncbi:MAG: hypothetical protein AAGH92_06685 [Planctomycetota bacterium]